MGLILPLMPASAHPPPPGSRRDDTTMALRLLIVDDEDAIRFAVTEYFSAYGEQIDSAADLASARALLARHRYDAVIADLRLGCNEEQAGLDIIDLASRLPLRPCIVLLSAQHSPELVQEALRRGAHLALHKPLPLYELKGRIKHFLAWRAAGGSDAGFRPDDFRPTQPDSAPQ
jgi:two-component system response regulator PilR (NtrC family)